MGTTSSGKGIFCFFLCPCGVYSWILTNWLNICNPSIWAIFQMYGMPVLPTALHLLANIFSKSTRRSGLCLGLYLTSVTLSLSIAVFLNLFFIASLYQPAKVPGATSILYTSLNFLLIFFYT